MRERGELIFRIACYVLAGLLLYRIAGAVRRSNPLGNVKIPALPALSSDTNAPAGKGTNAVAPQGLANKGTNVQTQALAKPGTNTAPVMTAKADTNLPSPIGPDKPNTGLPAEDPEKRKALLLAQQDALRKATNAAVRMEPEKPGTNLLTGTNLIAQAGSVKAGSNSPPVTASRPRPETARMNPSAPGRKPQDLPPPIKARVDRIYDSELLGQIMRPQPMALLGIAGNTAFLRSPSGQTGPVKEGGQLGEIKLLKIGINRVLVEQDGEKKELMIFSGYGGESLLPKP